MAGEFGLETLVVRYGVSGGSPIGEEQRIRFQQGDVAMTARLPWEREIASEWILGTKILGSAGLLRGAKEENAVVTFLPLDIWFGRKDGLVAIDVGGGFGLLSDYKFGPQNFGGPFQFVWTFGITSRFWGPVGAGYHFQHYSDATLYGKDSRGVDLHLFELVYWFGK